MRSKAALALCSALLSLSGWQAAGSAEPTKGQVSFGATVPATEAAKITARVDMIWTIAGLNASNVRAVFVCSIRSNALPKSMRIDKCVLSSSAGGSVKAGASVRSPSPIAATAGQGVLKYGTWLACVTVTATFAGGGGTATACGSPNDYTP